MKKLLIGLTLLTSMSSFAENCKMYVKTSTITVGNQELYEAIKNGESTNDIQIIGGLTGFVKSGKKVNGCHNILDNKISVNVLGNKAKSTERYRLEKAREGGLYPLCTYSASIPEKVFVSCINK